MTIKKYNWSDAWLLLAIVYASDENNGASLEKIIAAGDWINRAVFNHDELESGLARLTTGNFIKEKSGVFFVTLKVSQSFAKIASRDRTVEKELEYLKEFIGAASPASAQPNIDNLKYEGFSHAKFREAVNKYLSR